MVVETFLGWEDIFQGGRGKKIERFIEFILNLDYNIKKYCQCLVQRTLDITKCSMWLNILKQWHWRTKFNNNKYCYIDEILPRHSRGKIKSLNVLCLNYYKTVQSRSVHFGKNSLCFYFIYNIILFPLYIIVFCFINSRLILLIRLFIFFAVKELS